MSDVVKCLSCGKFAYVIDEGCINCGNDCFPLEPMDDLDTDQLARDEADWEDHRAHLMAQAVEDAMNEARAFNARIYPELALEERL